ncbi:hypothetical protein [Duganella sp. LjRoot269]|uniref:hypothetical protein n=1 Tax=Duganella sp. LjRoot269 TaxID=3342305 RepID=UPI003ED05D3E
MKFTESIGPLVISALIAVPGVMAYKTLPMSVAAACLEASAKEFNVSVHFLASVDHIEYGSAKPDQACQRYPAEAKALAYALSQTDGVQERALALFYGGATGLRAYDSHDERAQKPVSRKDIEQMFWKPLR